MVGLERSTLPLIGETEFGLGSSAAVLSFIVAFGLAKSFTNLGRGALAARVGRKRLLILGWILALPVPLLVGVAPSWTWIVIANVFLGVNQGLTWSMTVVMKIDLVGPRRRGLALGLNESAGYGGVALAAASAAGSRASSSLATCWSLVGRRWQPPASDLAPPRRDTTSHVALEQARDHDQSQSAPSMRTVRLLPRLRAALLFASRARQQPERRPGLGPGTAFLAAEGASVGEIGLVAGLYPAVWGMGQIGTGHWSDTLGRKPLIVAGMLIQALALALLAASGGVVALAAIAAVGLGAGTALVYPTLIAAISDAVTPVARAPTVGVYRFWRDMGYVVGGLIAGVLADAIDFTAAIARRRPHGPVGALGRVRHAQEPTWALRIGCRAWLLGESCHDS